MLKEEATAFAQDEDIGCIRELQMKIQNNDAIPVQWTYQTPVSRSEIPYRSSEQRLDLHHMKFFDLQVYSPLIMDFPCPNWVRIFHCFNSVIISLDQSEVEISALIL